MTARAAIGIDIGGTQVRAAKVNAAGEVLEWLAEATSGTPEAVLQQIEKLARRLATSDVLAIGVGVPGRVDLLHKNMVSGGYVDLAGTDLGDRLGGALKRPVFVDNDGSMALFAEHAAGAARSATTAVMLTIGTGIGGAVVINGKIFRGKLGASQLGHIAIERTGQKCLCGRRGCVETASSGTALARHIAEAGLTPGTTAEALLDRAARGDVSANAVIAAWAGPMRLAVDTLVATLDPEIAILGGGLGAAMHRALAGFPAASKWYHCAVAPAAFGDRAGVIGAGLAALAHSEEATARS